MNKGCAPGTSNISSSETKSLQVHILRETFFWLRERTHLNIKLGGPRRARLWEERQAEPPRWAEAVDGCAGSRSDEMSLEDTLTFHEPRGCVGVPGPGSPGTPDAAAGCQLTGPGRHSPEFPLDVGLADVWLCKTHSHFWQRKLVKEEGAPWAAGQGGGAGGGKGGGPGAGLWRDSRVSEGTGLVWEGLSLECVSGAGSLPRFLPHPSSGPDVVMCSFLSLGRRTHLPPLVWAKPRGEQSVTRKVEEQTVGGRAQALPCGVSPVITRS